MFEFTLMEKSTKNVILYKFVRGFSELAKKKNFQKNSMGQQPGLERFFYFVSNIPIPIH